MTIGQRIKDARKKAGMTQAELASKLDIPPQSIGQWERGERRPKLETLDRIAAALGVESFYLQTGSTLRKMSGLIIKSVQNEFYSDKGTRLSCKIDSNLYNNLAVFADQNNRTLEDEVEDRLYWSVEHDIEEQSDSDNN